MLNDVEVCVDNFAVANVRADRVGRAFECRQHSKRCMLVTATAVRSIMFLINVAIADLNKEQPLWFKNAIASQEIPLTYLKLNLAKNSLIGCLQFLPIALDADENLNKQLRYSFVRDTNGHQKNATRYSILFALVIWPYSLNTLNHNSAARLRGHCELLVRAAVNRNGRAAPLS